MHRNKEKEKNMQMDFIKAFTTYLVAGEPVEDIESGTQYRIVNGVLYEKYRDFPESEPHDWERSTDSLTELYNKQFINVGTHLLSSTECELIEWSRHLGFLRTIKKTVVDSTHDEITMKLGTTHKQTLRFTVIKGYLFGLLSYNTVYTYDYLEKQLIEGTPINNKKEK